MADTTQQAAQPTAEQVASAKAFLAQKPAAPTAAPSPAQVSAAAQWLKGQGKPTRTAAPPVAVAPPKPSKKAAEDNARTASLQATTAGRATSIGNNDRWYDPLRRAWDTAMEKVHQGEQAYGNAIGEMIFEPFANPNSPLASPTPRTPQEKQAFIEKYGTTPEKKKDAERYVKHLDAARATGNALVQTGVGAAETIGAFAVGGAAASLVLPEKLHALIQTGVDLGFTIQMLSQAATAYPKAVELGKQYGYDSPEFAQFATESGANLLFAAAGAAHLVSATSAELGAMHAGPARTAVDAADAISKKNYGQSFGQLDRDQRRAVVKEMLAATPKPTSLQEAGAAEQYEAVKPATEPHPPTGPTPPPIVTPEEKAAAANEAAKAEAKKQADATIANAPAKTATPVPVEIQPQSAKPTGIVEQPSGVVGSPASPKVTEPPPAPEWSERFGVATESPAAAEARRYSLMSEMQPGTFIRRAAELEAAGWRRPDAERGAAVEEAARQAGYKLKVTDKRRVGREATSVLIDIAKRAADLREQAARDDDAARAAETPVEKAAAEQKATAARGQADVLDHQKDTIERQTRPEPVVPPPGKPLAPLATRQTSQDRTNGVRRAPVTPLSTGAPTRVLMPDGTRLPAHYVVIRLNDLRPSHSPFNYRWYSDYPSDAQPREREIDDTAKARVETIGSHPDPEQLFAVDPTAQVGPPVVLPDGVVLAGNGRAMGIALAYYRGNGDVIADGIGSQPARFGEFQKADGDEPVPVIMLDEDVTSPTKLRRLGRDLNIGAAGGMTSAEEGGAAASYITDAKMAEIADEMHQMQESQTPDEEGVVQQVTLRKYIARYSKQLARFMMDSGMIPATAATKYVDAKTGELKEEGKALFESALLGKAIGSPRDVMDAETEAPSILHKLDRSLGLVNQIRGRGGDWDFTKFLPEALRYWVTARINSELISKSGSPGDSLVDRWMYPENYREGDLPLPGMEIVKPKVSAILARALGKSAAEVRDALGKYVEEMNRAGDPNQGGFGFAAAAANPVDVFNDTIAPLSDLSGQSNLRVTADDWTATGASGRTEPPRATPPEASPATAAAPPVKAAPKGRRKAQPPPGTATVARGDTAVPEDLRPTVEKSAARAARDAKRQIEREKFRKGLGQLNIGFDPEVFQSAMKLAYYDLRDGVDDFAEWSRGMIADFGEKARPYVEAAWNAAKQLISSGVTMPGEEEETPNAGNGQPKDTERNGGRERRGAAGPPPQAPERTRNRGATDVESAGVSGGRTAGSQRTAVVKTDEKLTHGSKAAPKVVNLAPPPPRGPAIVPDAEWRGRLKSAGLPEDMPAPTVRLPDDIAAKLTFPGQRELADYTLSSLEQNGGALLASTTGSGKTFLAASLVADLLRKKPDARVLVLTKNRGMIEQEERGMVDVFKGFGVQIPDMDIAAVPSKPGVFATTYAMLVRHPELADANFDLVVADESANARRWWNSDTGALTKKIGGNAKKALYMSATPFHTPLELGYMERLGLWPKGGFEAWVRQFGVYRDKSGWHGSVSAPMMAGFRAQMIQRGVFANMDIDLTGFNANFGLVPLTEQHHTQLLNVQRAFDMTEQWFRGRGKALTANRIRGLSTNFQKAWLERTRLPVVIEHVDNLLKNGWQAVIFTETKAGRDELYRPLQEADRALNGAIQKLMPTLPDSVEALRERYGDDLADLTGPYSARRKAELEAFLSGQKHVAIGTYASIGEGVSLHDTSGDTPRAAVYAGVPWSGIALKQGTGRLWRYGTKSDVHATFLFSDSLPEKALMDKVTARLASLNSSISGVERSKVLDGLRGNDAARVEANAYALGGETRLDPKDFAQVADTSSYRNWKSLEVAPAENAKNRGVGRRDTEPVAFRRSSPPPEPFPVDKFPDMPKNALEALRAHGEDFGAWSADMLHRYPGSGRELMPYLRAIWDDLHARSREKDLGPGGRERTPEERRRLAEARANPANVPLFGEIGPPPAAPRKGAAQAGLFDDNDSGTLFSRWWNGPARDAGVPDVLGEELDRDGFVRHYRTADGTSVYLADGGIGRLMHRSGIEAFSVRDSGQAAHRTLDMMRSYGPAAELMERVSADAKDGPVVVVASNEVQKRDIASVLAHELHHVWQHRLSRAASSLFTPSQLDELAKHPAVKKLAPELMAAGYPDRPDVAVMETAARLAAETPRAIGFTPSEAASFLDAYFTKLAERHGDGAEAVLEGVLRRGFNEAHERATEKAKAARVQGDGERNAGRAEPPPGSVPGVAAGREGGAGVEAGGATSATVAPSSAGRRRLVSDERYEAARKSLRDALFSSHVGLPLDKLPALVEVGLYHMENGARSFAEWLPKVRDELIDAGGVAWEAFEPRMRELYDYVAARAKSASPATPPQESRPEPGPEGAAAAPARATKAEPPPGAKKRSLSSRVAVATGVLAHPFEDIEDIAPELATNLRRVKAAPMAAAHEAEVFSSRIVQDLTPEQRWGFTLMADDSTREFLQNEHPDEFARYENDPAIQKALAYAQPKLDEMTATQKYLGGRTIPGRYFPRSYPEGVAEPKVTDFYDTGKIGPQAADKYRRLASAQFFYEHGEHDPEAVFKKKWIRLKDREAAQRAFESFAAEATSVAQLRSSPVSVEWRGERYYRPGIIRDVREASTPEAIEKLKHQLGVQELPKASEMKPYAEYRYAPANRNLRLHGERLEAILREAGVRDPRVLAVANDMAHDAAMSERTYLAPKKVVDAMNHAAVRDKVGEWLQEHSVGRAMVAMTRFARLNQISFNLGVGHIMNLARAVTMQPKYGALDLRGWIDAFRVANPWSELSKGLAARSIEGPDNPVWRSLLESGAVTPARVIDYTQDNFNPNSWMGWLASKSSGHLFGPGGMHMRVVQYIAENVKAEYPDATPDEVARAVETSTGMINRASWNQIQNAAGHFMLFPSWLYARARFALDHPLKTTLPPALIALAVNNALYYMAANKKQDRWDPTSIHIKNHRVIPTLVFEPLTRHMMAAPFEALLQAGGATPPKGQAWMEQVGGEVWQQVTPTLTEWMLMQPFNVTAPLNMHAIVQPRDYDRPGLLIPGISLGSEKRLFHAINSTAPLVTSIADEMNEGPVDSSLSILGGLFGVSNYPEAGSRVRRGSRSPFPVAAAPPTVAWRRRLR